MVLQNLKKNNGAEVSFCKNAGCRAASFWQVDSSEGVSFSMFGVNFFMEHLQTFAPEISSYDSFFNISQQWCRWQFKIQPNIWDGVFYEMELSAINCFRKRLHLKCLIGFWICLCDVHLLKKKEVLKSAFKFIKLLIKKYITPNISFYVQSLQ